MINNLNFNFKKCYSPVILFLHGCGLNSNFFNLIIDNLSTKNSILTVDFFGFGKSGEPKDYYDTYEYAYHIFLLLKKLNIDSLKIVAHSFGGRIAILLSSIFDIKVEKMILTASAGINVFSLKKILKISIYKVLKFLAKIKFLSYKFLRCFGSDDYKNSNGVLRGVFVRIVNQDLRHLLCKIYTETFLYWDKKDDVTLFKVCKVLNRGILGSKVLISQSGGHMCYIKNFNKFVFLINKYICL